MTETEQTTECPTCQGRGEVWVFLNGLARAPDPAQCDDCCGTGHTLATDPGEDKSRTLSMPLDEGLVEVVAQSIYESLDLSRGLKYDMMMEGQFHKAARAAIEAYEQARAAVFGSPLV
jgi:RecJ-like exonuclease